MKTIQVSDELYEKLMIVSKEMNTQNHLSTAMPYLWQIRVKKTVHGVEEGWHDGFEWVDDEYEGQGIGSESDDTDYENFLESMDLLSKWKKSNLDYEEFLEDEGYFKSFWKNEYEWKNGFFSRKACEEHIRLNDYHYEEPTPYLVGLFRNPELEAIQELICEISGGKIHK